jgi:hypothetical protein
VRILPGEKCFAELSTDNGGLPVRCRGHFRPISTLTMGDGAASEPMFLTGMAALNASLPAAIMGYARHHRFGRSLSRLHGDRTSVTSRW